MIEYPKIETLYDRDDKFKIIPGKLRLPEFGNIKRWSITEKVDGTNVRVIWDGSTVTLHGRTNNAQMPPPLWKYLTETFTADKMRATFVEGGATLYGEGYGPKIQKGGGLYRADVSFRLFDVLVGQWWLERADVADVAEKIGVLTVPELGEIDALPQSRDDLAAILGGEMSITAQQDGGAGLIAEGVIARTSPTLFTRRGDRLIWKLKFKDF